MGTVNRETVCSILLRWAANKLTEKDVHEEAERIWESEEWPVYDESDDRSIEIEVLSQLAILNHQLITVQDIPVMLEFLATPPGHAREGWERWKRYWESLDMDQRCKELAANPYYTTTPLDVPDS